MARSSMVALAAEASLRRIPPQIPYLPYFLEFASITTVFSRRAADLGL